MNLVRPEIELVVTAGDIPESVVLDISAMEIGDTATISDVALPAGAKPTIDREFVVANIQAPSGLASQSGDDDGDVEEVEEPEAAEDEEA